MTPSTQSSSCTTTTTANDNKRLKIFSGLLVLGLIFALAVVFADQQRHAKESKVAGADDTVDIMSPSEALSTLLIGDKQGPPSPSPPPPPPLPSPPPQLASVSPAQQGQGAKNLITPGNAIVGQWTDARMGGFVEGCTPETGEELAFLVENTTCPVITLLPGATYTLRQFIRVMPDRRVSVMGRPLNMPTIDAHRAYRSFTVEPGGVLDLRFIRLYRGKPIRLIRLYYYEIRGGGVYIRAGGTAIITGCLFTVNPILITEFLFTSSPVTTVRMLGGYLLMEAGTLTVTDSHFYVTRPGVLFREVYTVGGQVLIWAGNAIFTGCTFTSSLLFVHVVGIGDTLAVFGGTAVYTGCVFTFNCALVAGYGVGMLLFMGGGVAIFTGCVANNNIGASVFFGSGNGIFNGGGVTILTGMVFNTAVALLATAGVGTVNTVGGGVMIKTGVSQTAWAGCQFLATLGIAVFVGAGVVVESECVWARVAALTSWYGGGGSLYVGAGVTTLVNCAALVANGIVSAAIGGGNVANLAGWLTMVNTYFYSTNAIAAVYGQGGDVLVLAGGAVFVNSGYGGTTAIRHSNPGFVNIWVSGNPVYLDDKNITGVVATHKMLTYFSSARRFKSVVKMAGVTITEYEPEEVSRLFGFKTHHEHWRATQETFASITTMDEANKTGTTAEEDDMMSRSKKRGEGEIDWKMPLAKLPWPGMEVVIPQIPADVKTNNVYLAGPLDECSLCDVKPGRTSENFDGVGLAGCAVADTCEGDLLQRKGPSLAEQMWNPPKGMGLANTSIAILEIQTRYTPFSPTAARIEAASVKQAVEKASAALGLPQRFHLTVVPNMVNPLALDDADYVANVLKDVSDNNGLNGKEIGTSFVDEEGELMEAQLREGARKLQYQECSVRKTFKVIMVSDWRNVTQAHVKGFRTQDATQQLMMALQDAQTGSETVQICEASVKAADSLFVPGRKASLLQDDADGQSKSSFGFGQDKGLLSAEAELTDAVSGGRVEDVEVGETYSLNLQHFPAATPLTVKLVPRDGLAVMTLDTFASKPSDDADEAQVWHWTVGENVRSGAYYLEVATPQILSRGGALAGMVQMMDNNKLAFTQAFEVVG